MQYLLCHCLLKCSVSPVVVGQLLIFGRLPSKGGKFRCPSWTPHPFFPRQGATVYPACRTRLSRAGSSVRAVEGAGELLCYSSIMVNYPLGNCPQCMVSAMVVFDSCKSCVLLNHLGLFLIRFLCYKYSSVHCCVQLWRRLCWPGYCCVT